MMKKTILLAGILSFTMVTPTFAGVTNSFSVGEANIPSSDAPSGYIDTAQNALDVARNLVYRVFGSDDASIKRNRSGAVDIAALEYIDSISKRTEKDDVGLYDPKTYVRPTSTFIDIKEDGVEYRDGDDMQIIQYIRENIDSNFERKLYQVEEFSVIPGDDSMMLVTYRYKVGDAISDFGYMFNIEDYQVLGYKEMGVRLYDYPATSLFSSDTMKEEALRKCNAETEITDMIVEQTVSVEFDSASKEFIYYVNTGYEDKNGGQYGLTTEYRQIGDSLVERK